MKGLLQSLPHKKLLVATLFVTGMVWGSVLTMHITDSKANTCIGSADGSTNCNDGITQPPQIQPTNTVIAIPTSSQTLPIITQPTAQPTAAQQTTTNTGTTVTTTHPTSPCQQ